MAPTKYDEKLKAVHAPGPCTCTGQRWHPSMVFVDRHPPRDSELWDVQSNRTDTVGELTASKAAPALCCHCAAAHAAAH